MIELYQVQLQAVLDAQGKKRLLLSDEHRRLLAVKGKSLGRKALMELTTIVTPGTILRWHRQNWSPRNGTRQRNDNRVAHASGK